MDLVCSGREASLGLSAGIIHGLNFDLPIGVGGDEFDLAYALGVALIGCAVERTPCRRLAVHPGRRSERKPDSPRQEPARRLRDRGQIPIHSARRTASAPFVQRAGAVSTTSALKSSQACFIVLGHAHEEIRQLKWNEYLPLASVRPWISRNRFQVGGSHLDGGVADRFAEE